MERRRPRAHHVRVTVGTERSIVPLLSTSKKAETFAQLLEGSEASGPAGAASGELATLTDLAQRLSAVPQPPADFAPPLRAPVLQEAPGGLPPGPRPGGSGATGTGSAGSGPTGSATSPGASATSATSATSASGSAGSSVLGSAAPLWAQLAAGTAAATIAVSGVAVGA